MVIPYNMATDDVAVAVAVLVSSEKTKNWHMAGSLEERVAQMN